MIDAPWRADPAFGILCDMVASDRLVCMTGAGISSRLPSKADKNTKLPDWHKLLLLLFNEFRGLLPAKDVRDCERLLEKGSAGEPPTGAALMTAASIIRPYAPAQFDARQRELTTPAPGETTETHRGLMRLRPKGFLSFNYDTAQEVAAEEEGVDLDILLPNQDSHLAEAIAHQLKRMFLLKAHGDIAATETPLTLAHEHYRELLVRAPAYRAFVGNLLTNFSLFFIGFRMSDPDFDQFLITMAGQYGSPLNPHVAIFGSDTRSSQDIILRRQYGIHVLYVDDWKYLTELLADAAQIPGPRLRDTLDRCMDRSSTSARGQAHYELQQLGAAGRQIASTELTKQISACTDSAEDVFRLSEIAFSLGKVDGRANKNTLFSIIDKATHADPVGRALTVLREVLKMDDMPQLEQWHERFSQCPLTGDYSDRIIKYLDYLLVYIPSKYRS